MKRIIHGVFLTVLLGFTCGCASIPRSELRLAFRNPYDWSTKNAMRSVWRRGRSAVPFLIECLKDKDPNVRLTALRSLIGLGREARKAAPDVLALLHDPDERVREHAITAAALIAPDEPDTLGQLIGIIEKESILSESDEVVWDVQLALRALGILGDRAASASPLVYEIVRTHSDQGVQEAGYWALSRFGSEGVTALAVGLHLPEWRPKFWALLTLEAMKGKAVMAVPSLTSVLGDRTIMDDVPRVLLGVDPGNTVAAKQIVSALSNSNRVEKECVRAYLVCIGLRGLDGEEVIPALTTLCKSQDKDISVLAHAALVRCGSDDPVHVQALKNALSSPYYPGELAQVLPSLLSGRQALLNELVTPETYAHIWFRLKDPELRDLEYVNCLARGLLRIDDAASRAATCLSLALSADKPLDCMYEIAVQNLRSYTWGNRQDACLVLARYADRDAREIERLVRPLLGDSWLRVRLAAGYCLDAHGCDVNIEEMLRTALTSGRIDSYDHPLISRILAGIAPRGAELLPDFIDTLNPELADHLPAAVATLYRFAPLPRDAVCALRLKLHDFGQSADVARLYEVLERNDLRKRVSIYEGRRP